MQLTDLNAIGLQDLVRQVWNYFFCGNRRGQTLTDQRKMRLWATLPTYPSDCEPTESLETPGLVDSR
jgi:hypothetical protein